MSLLWIAALAQGFKVNGDRDRTVYVGFPVLHGLYLTHNLGLCTLHAIQVTVVDLDGSNGRDVERDSLASLNELNIRLPKGVSNRKLIEHVRISSR